MAEILLTTLADAVGGSVPASAVLRASASRSRSEGRIVTAPREVVVRLVDGVPEAPIVLEATGANWFWTITVEFAGDRVATISRNVQVPAQSVEWADLVDIDPRTMRPDPAAVPAWEAGDAHLQEEVDAAKAKADNSLQLGYALLTGPARPILGLDKPFAAAAPDGYGSLPQGPVEATIIYNITDAPPTQLASPGFQSHTLYGADAYGGVAARGTAHAFTALMDVENSPNVDNEHSAFMGWQRYRAGAKGRAWFTDYTLHGAIGTQQGLLNGITMLVNNYYNGQPTLTPAGGQWIVTKAGQGAGRENGHEAATTYKLGVGLGIVGSGGRPGARTPGYEIALQIGGAGSGWMVSGETSIINTGISIQDTLVKAIGIVPTGAAGAIMWGSGVTGPRIQPVLTDGLQILLNPAHKLGFYGKTPVAQQAAIAAATDLPTALVAIAALIDRISKIGITV